MKILKSIITIFFLVISFGIYAQIDVNGSDKKGKKKIILSIPAKEIKKPKSLKNDSKDGFKKAYSKEQKELAKKKKEEDLKNKGILTAAKISEERYLKSWKKINATFPKIDQDLGSFRTQAKSVRIICRDFQYPDGDRVTITINDIPVVSNITLKRAYQGFDLPLEVGLNKIAFIALNQGSSGPNTAAFKVYDNSGNLISSNEWNLATGAKATIIIAKDK